jgi:hypothetical protein
MKSWLAMVIAPTVALAAQSAMYSMVTPSCGAQARWPLHLTAAVALAIVVVLTVLALGESSLRHSRALSHDSDEAGARGRFLGDVAAAVAALSALVILGMWFSIWVLTPCDI